MNSSEGGEEQTLKVSVTMKFNRKIHLLHNVAMIIMNDLSLINCIYDFNFFSLIKKSDILSPSTIAQYTTWRYQQKEVGLYVLSNTQAF